MNAVNIVNNMIGVRETTITNEDGCIQNESVTF